MPEKIIVLANRKGGTGKTTSSAYLAAVIHERGHKVTGIDTDPDQSWLKWARAGMLPYDVVAGDRDKLVEQVETMEGFVFIDTPPNDEAVIYRAGSIADEVIVPLAPTGLDVGRLGTTIRPIADLERMRGAPLASVLLTRWNSRLNLSRDVDELLGEKKMPLLDARIRQLTRYAEFARPTYLEEYEAVLKELEII